MKRLIILAVTPCFFAACDVKVGSDAPPTVEKSTTVVNPPAVKDEKKTETTTVTAPGGTVEKKTTETSN